MFLLTADRQTSQVTTTASQNLAEALPLENLQTFFKILLRETDLSLFEVVDGLLRHTYNTDKTLLSTTRVQNVRVRYVSSTKLSYVP